MHRHGYKGRKFGRERDQRGALKTGLTLSLIEYQSITTTIPKAKEIRPAAEKLISLAKKGGLANRRLIIARLGDIKTANLLTDRIVPIISRDSGYLRVVKLDKNRVGDNAELARLEFVDVDEIRKALETNPDKSEVIKSDDVSVKPEEKITKASADKKPDAKKEAK